MGSPVLLTEDLPKPGDAGFFGSVRRYDVHTGIDLYTDDGEAVYALEDGIVVAIEKFTGEHADSPWWNNTWALLVEGESGVIVYGEITIADGIEVGSQVEIGDVIGNVKQVLKKDKGVNPPAMLHLELMEHGNYKTQWWKLGEPQPKGLLNPYNLINPLTRYKSVVVFPDWCATGIWGDREEAPSASCPVDWLPVSKELQHKITTMQKEFDKGDIDWDNGGVNWPDSINCDWKARCLDIVKDIKRELPEWTVKYNNYD